MTRLTVVPALSHDPWYGGERGTVDEVALRPGRWTDREQAERLSALGRSILAAMSGATTQMDGASAQMRAVGDAIAAELEKLTMVPVAPVGRPARHG